MEDREIVTPPNTDLPVTVSVSKDAKLSGNMAMLTASVAITPGKASDMSKALNQLRSRELKDQVFKSRIDFGLGRYGMAVSGGPRPVTGDDGVIRTYEQDFKFTADI
jgi:hypothetical protein